jgi:peptidoglycan/xylan/chitin deacetylase (PgdA/CDA1 family)
MKQPLLVITFDDFFPSDYEVVFPVMRRLGIVGTSYVNTATHLQRNTARKKKDFWNAIKTMRASGWNIECHTDTHTNVDTMTEAQVRANMVDLDTKFVAQGLSTPRHHALPYGMHSPLALSIISEYRSTIRTTVEGLDDWDTINLKFIKGISMDMHTEAELDTFKAQVLEAIANKKIMTTYSHEQSPDGAASAWTGKIGLFTAFLEWAVRQPIKIVTMEEMYQLVKEHQST